MGTVPRQAQMSRSTRTKSSAKLDKQGRYVPIRSLSAATVRLLSIAMVLLVVCASPGNSRLLRATAVRQEEQGDHARRQDAGRPAQVSVVRLSHEPFAGNKWANGGDCPVRLL